MLSIVIWSVAFWGFWIKLILNWVKRHVCTLIRIQTKALIKIHYSFWYPAKYDLFLFLHRLLARKCWVGWNWKPWLLVSVLHYLRRWSYGLLCKLAKHTRLLADSVLLIHKKNDLYMLPMPFTTLELVVIHRITLRISTGSIVPVISTWDHRLSRTRSEMPAVFSVDPNKTSTSILLVGSVALSRPACDPLYECIRVMASWQLVIWTDTDTSQFLLFLLFPLLLWIMPGSP